MSGEPAYLGDGVYVKIVAGMICLTTENGVSTTNEIFLDSDVYAALQRYLKRQNAI